MYDIIVVGAGPAGLVAGVIAARLKLNTLVLAKEFSLPPVSSEDKGIFDIEQLHKGFLLETKINSGKLSLILKTEVTKLDKNVVSFSVETKSGQVYYSKSVVVCSGQDYVSGEGTTDFDLLAFKDSLNKIKVDSNMATNVQGFFAAGCVISGLTGNAFACGGQGAMAVLSARSFVRK